MEQFNLEKWLDNPNCKVVTRDGRSVRILDYNLKGDKHICIAVDDEIQESITTVDEDGHCLRDKTGWHESNFDLFFADEEEELTEFEKALDVFAHNSKLEASNPNYYDWLLKSTALKLLDLARKELEKEDWRKPLRVYKNGYKQGKQDALKHLPKWKKATEHKKFVLHVCVIDEDMYPFLDTEVNEGDYYIELSDLKTLPKEE